MAKAPEGPKRIHDLKGPNNPIPGSENWPVAQINHMVRFTILEAKPAVRVEPKPPAEKQATAVTPGGDQQVPLAEPDLVTRPAGGP